MNQPKPKSIRLPFSVPSSNQGATPQVRVCGICRIKDSNYTCPRCNIAYCSLDCFRDQKHSQCSEPFYRDTIRESIASDSKADLDQKKDMLEILKRFEEGTGDDDDLLRQLSGESLDAEEAEEEDVELAERLAGVDLDTIDSNSLLRLLPQAHRDAFLATIRDPESVEAKALLELATRETNDSTAEDDEAPEVLPWWEASSVVDEGGGGVPPCADPPEMVDEKVLSGITPPTGMGIRLAYNAIAISLAYIHALLSCRLPSLSPHHTQRRPHSIDNVKTVVNHLVPFLPDTKSTTLYSTTRQAWTAIWESIQATYDGEPLPTLALLRLLNNTSSLLHPPLETDRSPRILLVLSDLYHLSSIPKVGGAIPRKLAFYITALKQLDRAEWLRLEGEVKREIGRLEAENDAGRTAEVSDDAPSITSLVIVP